MCRDKFRNTDWHGNAAVGNDVLLSSAEALFAKQKRRRTLSISLIGASFNSDLTVFDSKNLHTAVSRGSLALNTESGARSFRSAS